MPVPEPNNVTLVISEFSRRRVGKFFGRTVSDTQLAALVGALDNATIEIAFSRNGFEATVKHEYIVEQYRVIGAASEFGFFINNVFFELAPDAPDGLGLLSFARQVAAAKKLEFTFIRTFAEGYFGDPNNFIGYYMWARFGFDAPLSADEVANLPPGLAGCTDLNDARAARRARMAASVAGRDVIRFLCCRKTRLRSAFYAIT